MGILGFLLVLNAVLFICALISLARNRTNISSGGTVVWAVVILAVPVLGPVLWFSSGRGAARHNPNPSPPNELANSKD